MFFKQMKACSVSSLGRHELILPTLYPGWRLNCHNKGDTEPTHRQDILAWAQCHTDRTSKLLLGSESGQGVSSYGGTHSLRRASRSYSLLLHCGDPSLNVWLMVKIVDISENFTSSFLFFFLSFLIWRYCH